MRTVGCGWTQSEAKWTFFADERQHTIDQLRRMLLDDILPHEIVLLRRQKRLPTSAAPHHKVTRMRALKKLGTDDADALRLGGEGHLHH